MNKLFTVFGFFILMIVFSSNYAIAQETTPSPMIQIRMGIEPQNVQCNDGLQLIIRSSNNMPACVKPSTAEILSHRILAIIVKSSSTLPIEKPQPITDKPQTINDTQSLVDANNKFMLDFFSKTSKPEENSFFSPWSMLSAFSVLYEGTRGQTADEIASVFYLPKDDSSRRTSFESMQDDLNVNGSGYELRNANALWVQQGYGIKEEFVNTARQYYDSKASEVSFPKDEPVIDSWVEQKTNDKIKELVKGKTTTDTRLVITNAIYFKGTWQTQFESSQTRDDEFRVNAAKTVQAPMMHLQSRFSYAETDDLQVLAMPYKEQRMSMLVLLPKNDIESLEKSISLENLEDWKTKLKKQEVMLSIPKFKLETQYDLSESMKELGMKKVFDIDAADLSGISNEKPLFVGFAIHKAFVDVNEEGTEATAATGIGVGVTSAPPPPKIFHADHPFIFLIQDNETGLILFMGKVTDPTN